MAFDFNSHSDIDDNSVINDTKTEMLFYQEVTPILKQQLEIGTLTGFAEEHNNIIDSNITYKYVKNPNSGFVDRLVSLVRLKGWQLFRFNKDVDHMIHERVGDLCFTRLKKLVDDKNTIAVYIYISPDNGLYYVQAKRRPEYNWLCMLGVTGKVEYNSQDAEAAAKTHTDNLNDVAYICKIVKQYNIKISPAFFKPVNIPGTQYAMMATANYTPGQSYRVKPTVNNWPNLSECNNIIRRWRNWHYAYNDREFPDFIKNNAEGEIRYVQISTERGMRYNTIEDVISWTEWCEDGNIKWYIAVFDNYKHDKTGKRID